MPVGDVSSVTLYAKLVSILCLRCGVGDAAVRRVDKARVSILCLRCVVLETGLHILLRYPVSILCLRCPLSRYRRTTTSSTSSFNSLFEMLCRKCSNSASTHRVSILCLRCELYPHLRKERLDLRVSILCLRCIQPLHGLPVGVDVCFNSLFEMRGAPYYASTTSILMTCVSILCLRCRCFYGFLRGVGSVACFNSLFEMHPHRQLFRLWHHRRVVSILCLRCINANKIEVPTCLKDEFQFSV